MEYMWFKSELGVLRDKKEVSDQARYMSYDQIVAAKRQIWVMFLCLSPNR
jgi:hypothetical protein